MTQPLVSIVVNNHNYERFVAAAIDSALAQTWTPLEVVVVDDGSTDGSWGVISGYGSRLRAIRQANGGQGAAYNTGFAASRGEWVLFLDADDVLDADAIEKMMALAEDGVAKVQGYLRHIGADGELLGGAVPYLAHDGDVTAIARAFRQYASPPGSGNLFRRSAIAPYLPMPEVPWRRAADTVPILLSVFHGRVATVPGPIGGYRTHRAASARSGMVGNVNRSLAESVRMATRRCKLAEEWGTYRGRISWPRQRHELPWSWRTRALSWRLRPAEHPYPADTRSSIRRGLDESLAHWPGYTAIERFAMRAWLLAVLWAPRGLGVSLAPSNASGAWRSRLRALRRGRLSW